MGSGQFHAFFHDSFFWIIVWLVLAGAGMYVQWRSAQQYTMEWAQTTQTGQTS
jgi:hypothetical protein